MSKLSTKGYYFGRPVEDLTKEELEDALVEVAKSWANREAQMQKELNFLTKLRNV